MKLPPFLRLQLTRHLVKLCVFLVQIGNILFPFPSQLYCHYLPLLSLGREMWDSIRSKAVSALRAQLPRVYREPRDKSMPTRTKEKTPNVFRCFWQSFLPRPWQFSFHYSDKPDLKHHLDVQLMEHKRDELAKSPQTCQYRAALAKTGSTQDRAGLFRLI